jgi:hypothetical protein
LCAREIAHGVHMHRIARFALPVKQRASHAVADRVGAKNAPTLPGCGKLLGTRNGLSQRTGRSG